jgi:hypothetical protein
MLAIPQLLCLEPREQFSQFGTFQNVFGEEFYLLKQASVVGHSSSAWQPTSTGSAVTQQANQEGSR